MNSKELKTYLKKLNNENIDNSFRETEAEAKKDTDSLFSWNMVKIDCFDYEFFEAVQDGYPLSIVAERADVSLDCVEIVATRLSGKNHKFRKI